MCRCNLVQQSLGSRPRVLLREPQRRVDISILGKRLLMQPVGNVILHEFGLQAFLTTFAGKFAGLEVFLGVNQYQQHLQTAVAGETDFESLLQ